jgi:hypothetical protein
MVAGAWREEATIGEEEKEELGVTRAVLSQVVGLLGRSNGCWLSVLAKE